MDSPKENVPKTQKEDSKSEIDFETNEKSSKISPPDENTRKSKSIAKRKSKKARTPPAISISGAAEENIPSPEVDLPLKIAPSWAKAKEKVKISPRNATSNLEREASTIKLEIPDLRKKRKRQQSQSVRSNDPLDADGVKKTTGNMSTSGKSMSGREGKNKEDEGPKSETTGTVAATFIPELTKVIEDPGMSSDCLELMDELWEYAWSICANRFYIGNAPLVIALELRDTWLRIMEVEWLDEGVNSYQGRTLPTSLFKPDEPIPALENDPWSRGTLVEYQPQPSKQFQLGHSAGI